MVAMAAPPPPPLPPFLVALVLASALALGGEAKLSLNYYRKSCPQFEDIVRRVVTDKQISNPSTAAGTIRLFFHDCFVRGCDASILVSSTPFQKSEREADINLSLPGDAFDVVVRVKTALELACPRIVSCADILAVATRDLNVMVGGYYYPVFLGRKDAKFSNVSDVDGNLPLPDMSMEEISQIFKSRGFTAQEMVALSGAHTLGFSHCNQFSKLIYNYSKESEVDPRYNPAFARSLQEACATFKENPTLSVFNDVMTPNKFDNKYFQNVREGLGLLASDHALSESTLTAHYVNQYAAKQELFLQDFARAMQKLSLVGVLVGPQGEVRRRCDMVN